MRILIALREFFWPWLEPLSAEEAQEQKERREGDRARIDALNLSGDWDIALEEARRMADSEAERRRGTDQKASTYLPLVAALVPLILTVVSTLWEKKAGSAPGWLNMPLLGLAVAYTAVAGLWAFRVLEVTVSHEPGLGDFELSWRKPHPARALVRRILLYTRLNQDRINWKVSCIKMAHAFLLRAFITFSLLLLLNIVWYLAALLASAQPSVLRCSTGDEATAEIRAAHEAVRRAHLEGNAELMASGMAGEMAVVSNGDVSVNPKAKMTSFFKSYFARVKYLEWSDAATPIINVSPDGRMGWMAVKVRARYLERGKPEAPEKAFNSSWIATYQRVGCEWKMTGNASAVIEE